jgi:ferredoxin
MDRLRSLPRYCPGVFAREDDGYSKVIMQPSSAAEIEVCIEARDSCPVSAVIDNGE